MPNLVGTASAQSNLEIFGQNRLQYRKFNWQFYEAKQFKVYHYDRSGRNLARYVVEQAEQDVAAVERRLGGLFPEKLSIILYNSYNDYTQSNIGLNTDLQIVNNNAAGTLNIVGEKLVIYFTGNHHDLKTQLRKGMARAITERLIYGENIREIVRNAIILDLPEWVTEGYVDYVVNGWTSANDTDWKNLIYTENNSKMHKLAQKEPILFGKAFWKYISVRYGENNVRNILYMTQMKGGEDKALKSIVQLETAQLFDSIKQFYQNRYNFEQQLFEKADSQYLIAKIPIPQDESIIRNIAISPRGGDMAYIRWKHGEFDVIMEKLNMKDGERSISRILSGGIKNFKEKEDPDYPLLAWNNTGFKLGIVYEKNDRIRIRIYDGLKAKVRNYSIPKNRFDRITGFTFTDDDGALIVTAIKNGKSDLYEYRFRGNRITPLTDDEWDEEQPVFVMGGSRKGILFISNRPEPYMNIRPLPNELPTGNRNLFFYNTTTKRQELLQLTQNEKSNISQAIAYGMDHFAFLSNQNGINNRYLILFNRNEKNVDTPYSVPITNYEHNILYQQYNPASQKMADVLQVGSEYHVYFRPINFPPPLGDLQIKKPLPIAFIDGVLTAKTLPGKAAIPINSWGVEDYADHQNDAGFVIEKGNVFQSEFNIASSNEQKNQPSKKETLVIGNLQDNEDTEAAQYRKIVYDENMQKRVLYVDSSYIRMRSQKYRLSLTPDFFSLRADNSILFTRYQSYENNGGQFNNPTIGGMFAVSLSDLMEDYHFTGGMRMEANLSGFSTFAKYENYRQRIDWGLVLFRYTDNRDNSFNINNNLFQIPVNTTNYILQGNASYPIDKVQSIRMNIGVRYDKMTMRAREYVGLVMPSTNDYWALSRLEYVYDNSRNPTLNIWNGLRAKAFGEYMYKLYTDNDVYHIGSINTNKAKKGGFYTVGFDVRYYKKLYRNLILAVRAAGAHAGGSHKVIYYLGGVDNQFSPNFRTTMQPSEKNQYAFQSLATNMRGYDQNARNGNNYLLTNVELRLPLMSTFFDKPIRSDVLNNLQVAAFFDLGNAWEGPVIPVQQSFQRYTTLYWPNVFNPTVTVRVPNNVDQSVAMGYGFGLRTKLLGYFVKADAAWNVRRDFVWYISLGTDF